MTPEPYGVLFEPVPIGPLVARNRFFQVPHCNGMGYRDPSAQAELRRVKAEGGWAVVCTEQAEIHPTSDITPFIELRIWDDQDLPALARIAGAIHEGGALAGIELCHNGLNAPNLYTREIPLGAAPPAGGHLRLRPGPGPDDDQAGPRRPAALAPQRGPAGACGPGTTSSTSTPGTGSAASSISCPRGTTSAPTSTAAAPATGCGCSARSWRTPGRPRTAGPRSPAGSAWTRVSVTRACAAATSRRSSASSASCPTCGTSSWGPGSRLGHLPVLPRKAGRRSTSPG